MCGFLPVTHLKMKQTERSQRVLSSESHVLLAWSLFQTLFGDLKTRDRNLGQQRGLFVSPACHQDTYKTPSGRVNRVKAVVVIGEGLR